MPGHQLTNINSPKADAVVILMSVLFTCIFSYLSYVRFLDLSAPTFDLGVKIQSVTTAFLGFPVDNANYVVSGSIYYRNFFAIHFSPLTYLMSIPLHFLTGPISLFILQWASIAAAAAILYLLSKEIGFTPKLSVLIFVTVLLFPPTLMSGMYDVHFISLFPLASLLTYYGGMKRNWPLLSLGILLGFASQEAFMLLLPFIILQLIVDRGVIRKYLFRQSRMERIDIGYVVIAGCSVFVFLLELRYMQFLAPIRPDLVLSSSGYGLNPLNLGVFLVPKLEYFLIAFGTLLFIPFFAPKKLLMAIPGIAVILASVHLGFAQLQFQYSFVYAGGVFLAYLYGLKNIVSLMSKWQKEGTFGRGKLKRFLGSSYSRGAVLMAPLVVVILLSPTLPVSHMLPDARPIDQLAPPGNLAAFQSMLSLMPANATILASDYVFPHVAGDENAYPILHSTINGTSVAIDGLPADFSPRYVLIFPSDYTSAGQIVAGFPSDYGVLAESMLIISTNNFLSTSYFDVYVILFEIGYHGQARLYKPAFHQALPIGDFQMTSGSVVSVPAGSFLQGVEFTNNGSGPFVLLHGPSTSSYAYTLLPGEYDVSLYLNLFIDNETLAAQNAIGAQIASYSNSLPFSWSQVNLTNNSFSHTGLYVATMHINAYRPIFWFSTAIYALKPGYGVIFYGAEIVQTE